MGIFFFSLFAEEDGPVELQETARLRDRGSGKKDRDRDRDRERDRDRDRERDRDRLSRSKRRRGDRLTHGNRDDGGDESSEESVNDEEEDEDDDGGVGGGVGGGSVRMLPPPNPSAVASLSSSSSMLNHQRKSFPPVKNFRAAPTWKAADEMIGVSVPRKARSGRAVEEIERQSLSCFFFPFFSFLSLDLVVGFEDSDFSFFFLVFSFYKKVA